GLHSSRSPSLIPIPSIGGSTPRTSAIAACVPRPATTGAPYPWLSLQPKSLVNWRKPFKPTQPRRGVGSDPTLVGQEPPRSSHRLNTHFSVIQRHPCGDFPSFGPDRSDSHWTTWYKSRKTVCDRPRIWSKALMTGMLCAAEVHSDLRKGTEGAACNW